MADQRYPPFASQARPRRGSSDPRRSFTSLHGTDITTPSYAQKQDLLGLPTGPDIPTHFSSASAYASGEANRSNDDFPYFPTHSPEGLSLPPDPGCPWPRSYPLVENELNSSVSAVPIQRFASEERELPWNSVRATGVSPTTTTKEHHSHQTGKQMSHMRTKHQGRPSVDMRSQANQTDEGYYTLPSQSQHDSRSVYSATAGNMTRRNQTFNQTPQSLLSYSPFSQDVLLPEESYSVQHHGSVSGDQAEPQIHRDSLICTELNCGQKCKTQSELKKHEARHKLAHVCLEEGCTRNTGFATINDLDRHKKTVHKIQPTHGLSREYKCFASGCTKHSKEWPRLDNFKQHLKRMHKDENTEQLVKKSDDWFDNGKKPKEVPTRRHSLTHSTTSLSRPRQSQPSLNPGTDNASRGGWRSTNATGPRDEQIPSTSEVTTLHVSDLVPFNAPNYWRQSQGDLPTASGSSFLSPQEIFPTPLQRERRRGPSSTFGTSSVFEHQDQNSVQPQRRFGHSLCDPQSLPPAGRAGSRTAPEPSVPSLEDRLAEFPASSTSQSYPDVNFTSEVLTQIASNPLNHDSINVSPDESGLDASPYPSTMPAPPADEQMKNPSRFSTNSIEAFLRQHAQQHPDGKLIITVSSFELSQAIALHGSSATAEGSSVTANSASANSTAITSTTEDGKILHHCQKCDKKMTRPCDLKKHMKRHDKPYGCTVDKCYKHFGSKDDWKRHERTRHFQQECWRCEEKQIQTSASRIANGTTRRVTCCKLFYRRDFYVQHLRDEHKISDEKIRSHTKTLRIGRDSQTQYWCGFCKKINALKAKGVEGSDERFNHIDDHFMKGRLNINEWLLPEGDTTKGEAFKMDIPANDDNNSEESHEEEDGSMDISFASAESTSAPAGSGSKRTAGTAFPEDNLSQVHKSQQLASSSTAASSSSSAPARRKAKTFTCCHCAMGPFLLKLHNHCDNCGKQHCENCRFQ